MTYLYHALKRKEKELLETITHISSNITDSNEGRIHVSYSNQKPQYYLFDGSSKNGIYLKNSQKEQAQRIIQRDYEKKLLNLCKKQLSKIQGMLKGYNPSELALAFDNLSPGRKVLTIPAIVNDQQYIEQWQSRSYTRKPFYEDNIELYSNRGERVRSKSEKMIADYLYQEGIPYLYEAPLYIQGFGTIYPDFTLLDIENRKEIYYEHLGMMDNDNYLENAILKINAYIRNGYLPGDQLLLTFESSQKIIDIRVLQNITSSLKRNTVANIPKI